MRYYVTDIEDSTFEQVKCESKDEAESTAREASLDNLDVYAIWEGFGDIIGFAFHGEIYWRSEA